MRRQASEHLDGIDNLGALRGAEGGTRFAQLHAEHAALAERRLRLASLGTPPATSSRKERIKARSCSVSGAWRLSEGTCGYDCAFMWGGLSY